MAKIEVFPTHSCFPKLRGQKTGKGFEGVAARMLGVKTVLWGKGGVNGLRRELGAGGGRY